MRGAAMDNVTTTEPAEIVYQDEMRAFMLTLRRALLMVVRWIEGRYLPDA